MLAVLAAARVEKCGQFLVGAPQPVVVPPQLLEPTDPDRLLHGVRGVACGPLPGQFGGDVGKWRRKVAAEGGVGQPESAGERQYRSGFATASRCPRSFQP